MTHKYSRRTALLTAGALATVGVANLSLATEGAPTSSERIEHSGTWSQFRAGPSRTGAVAPAAAPASEHVGTAWKALTGEPTFTSEPVVGDGAVYQPFAVSDTSSGGVVAYDRETGDERWRRVASDSEDESSGIGKAYHTPAVGDGRLYLTSQPGYSFGSLQALDTRTGETVWERPDGSWGGPLLLRDGSLFSTTSAEEGEVIAALDPATGEVKWTTDGFYTSSFFGLDDGVLYGMRTYTDASNELVAWDASDGSIEWVTTVENLVNFRNAAVAGETLIRSTEYETPDTDAPDEVVAHDASDGSVRWRTTLSPDVEDYWEYLSAPAVADGTVYVHAGPSPDSENARAYETGILSTVYALDAETGDVEWTHETSTALLGDPSVAGDTVYVAGHALSKVDSDGPSIDRRYPAVHALATSDGAERWAYLFRSEFDASVLTAETPVVSDGRVYVTASEFAENANDGVFALEADDDAPDSENVPLSSDAPVAHVGTDPRDAEDEDLDAGTTVALDGAPSTGEVETYEWDLDGSGSFETTGRTADVTLDFCGSLTVSLRVTGPGGAQSTSSVTFSTI